MINPLPYDCVTQAQTPQKQNMQGKRDIKWHTC